MERREALVVARRDLRARLPPRDDEEDEDEDEDEDEEDEEDEEDKDNGNDECERAGRTSRGTALRWTAREGCAPDVASRSDLEPRRRFAPSGRGGGRARF